jgi:cell division protein FtsL
MNKAQKSQRSNNEKIIIVVVLIVVSVGIAYMAYDYVTTMDQLDNLRKETTENLSLAKDSNIDSVGNDSEG